MDREKAVTTRATNGHRVFLRAARTGAGGGGKRASRRWPKQNGKTSYTGFGIVGERDESTLGGKVRVHSPKILSKGTAASRLPA